MFEKWYEIAINYRYLNQKTWVNMDQLIDHFYNNYNEFLSEAEKISKHHLIIDIGLICAFHLIVASSKKDAIIQAQAIIECINEIRPLSISSYLQAKLETVKGNFEKAFLNFDEAKTLYLSESYDLKNILEAMGTITSADSFKDIDQLFLAVINNDIANVYLKQGDFSKAVEYFSEAYFIQKNNYTNHQTANVAYTLRNWADAYFKMERFEEAKAKCNDAFEIAKLVYEDTNHPEYKALELMDKAIKEKIFF